MATDCVAKTKVEVNVIYRTYWIYRTPGMRMPLTSKNM